MSQSALARELRINRASAMTLATILEEQGYVAREALPGRKQTALSLSSKGQAKLAEACLCEEELVAETMSWLDPEALTSFVAALKGVAARASRAPV